MKDFVEWLRENTSNVTVTFDALQQAFNAYAEKLIAGMHERQYQVSMFNPQQFTQELQAALPNYPLLKNLIRALESKNAAYVFDQQKKLRNWLDNLKLPYQQTEKIRELSRKIWTYVDYFDQKDGIEGTEEQIWQSVQEAMKASQQEMAKLKTWVEQAISRIPNWNGSPITMEAQAPENEYGVMLQASEDAYVTVGTGEFAPSFSMFQLPQLTIDDVIEGGDTDFFHTPQLQADYFNLINELRNPGSTNRGKTLTLYTARPVEDRQMYVNATTLPTNVFLTNSYNHVEGIAIDLGGSGGPRDIWKVKIDSRYLTQTMDGPIKYYQITVPNAPAKLELIYKAEREGDEK